MFAGKLLIGWHSAMREFTKRGPERSTKKVTGKWKWKDQLR